MFEHTADSIQEVVAKYVDLETNTIEQYPAKQKRQWAILYYLHRLFKDGHTYHEKEVNALLKPWYEDYLRLRRDLVDFQFLSRTPDGSLYEKKSIQL